MPVYDYRCPICKNRLNDKFVHKHSAIVACPKCKVTMNRLFPSRVSIDCFPAEGIHLKHVCPGGKTFYSKKEMAQYAKSHNLELGALL